MKWIQGGSTFSGLESYLLDAKFLVIWLMDSESGWQFKCPAINMDWKISIASSLGAAQRDAVRTVVREVRLMYVEAERMFEKYGVAQSIAEEESNT